jgi:cell division protein FtsQ
VSATAYTLVRRRTLPRWAVALALIAVIAGGAWMWLRDSSLVAVKRVTITGDTGPDAAQIRAALNRAARNMTTLDVHLDQLQTAVAPYAVVKNLQVATSFPHGLTIHVVEQVPVAMITAGGKSIPVSGDGTLLHDLPASSALPSIPMSVPPGGTRLADAPARNAVSVLAAAPYDLLGAIATVSTVSGHGLTVTLRSGETIYFGDSTLVADKWTAAVAVLGDSGSAGAQYIDVSDPARPAAGVGSDAASAKTPATTTQSATTPAPTATTTTPTRAIGG